MVARTDAGPLDSAHGLSGLGLHARYQLTESSLIAQLFQLITAQDPVDEEGQWALQRALTSARLLSDLEAHPACIVVALLRALPWSQQETLPARLDLDPEIWTLAQELHRLDHIVDTLDIQDHPKSSHEEHIEGIRKLLLTLVQDIRVVLIALAERVWLMRRSTSLDEPTQRQLARQTLDLYTPLANRLGVWFLKWELEDLSLRALEPETYKTIAHQLDERFIQRERYIAQLIQTLQDLLQENGIVADVTGRPKHIFSIVKKMRAKNLSLERVYDIRAVRVIVNTLPECYTVLGLVHQCWVPVAGEFDDYIARPKGNQYRSLHTAVYGPENKIVEVQIRTHEMHRDSELGIASHWRYKEGARTNRSFEERVVWLRQMLDWQREAALNTGASLPPGDETLFVFTPQGRIIDLPQGSTPIDFAYHVHSELGHRCRGAKVDGRMTPLNQPLNNGQRVEILTVRQGGPSRDWLNPAYGYLKTHRAQAKVRQWFKLQHWEEDLSQGRTLLDKWMSRTSQTALSLEELANRVGYARTEDFLVALARNEVTLRQLDNLLAPPPVPQQEITLPLTTPSPSGGNQGVLVVGVSQIATTIAKCCKPVPPEPILGFVTRGRGVSIHRANCRSLAALTHQQWQRLIPVSWGENPPEQPFSTDIGVLGQDRQGLLRDISEAFTREKVNVTGVNTHTHGTQARMRFTVQIDSLEQLARTLKILQAVPGVTAAWRT
ncbi:bifunctional (p)ppGpp synthetase/guanosine-3',5'-bis(diphosphate) 3'-pyrophosphohydrolase [Ferrovum sp.]|uniref:RelA/SpoT family protein n=1 Tax=Ferrovum sp. TaxID=2609467 RepID=UPI00260CEC12|nr:bifunctional (p)ppGpp synthetase/guanosine-3',5'-bis(diphosphate) 3'-pyrophosphohydrolase [Ferrovum sp.]